MEEFDENKHRNNTDQKGTGKESPQQKIAADHRRVEGSSVDLALEPRKEGPCNALKRKATAIASKGIFTLCWISSHAQNVWESVKSRVFCPISGLVTLVVRIVLLVINTCLLMISLILIVLGVMIMTRTGFMNAILAQAHDMHVQAVKNFDKDSKTGESSISHIVETIAYGFIAFGSMVGFVSLIGCIGSGMASRRLLSIYIDGGGVLLLIEIVVLAVVFDRQEIGKSRMYKSLSLYSGITGTDPVTKGWNMVMVYLDCCGVEGYKDFQDLMHWPPRDVIVNHSYLKTPIICCRRKRKNITCALDGVANPRNSNMHRGCYQAIFDMILKNHITTSFIVLLFLFQFAAIFFASWILWNQRKEAEPD